MSRTAYRVVLTLLGLAFVAVVVGTVLFAPSGEPREVPDVVVEYSPGHGDLAFGQPEILLQLQPGYRAVLVVDGRPIPEDELIWIEATGLHVYRPGPGKIIESWSPGIHTVEARWDRTDGRPDPGAFSWSFRVQ